ncbi:MAG: hypothetical protein J0M26_24970 [Planctomycetes bacterium]|nr:hypothetical protein [Planctomycetota bacterium]
MNSMATIALAWKEFRQLLGISLAISVCAILGFIVSMLLQNISPSSNPIEFFYSIVPATLTPITIAMAGAVIAVGGEKQAGNWQWLTTLPVTWARTFFVKITVLLGVAFAAGVIVYLASYGICAISNSPLAYEMNSFGYDYRLMLFALPIALLWAMIMCLCLREPMVAILVAAVITLIQGFVKNLILSEYVSSTAPTDFGVMAIATAIETIILLLVTIYCYRLGWWNHEPIFESIMNSRVKVDESATFARWGTWSKPGFFWASIWQSFQIQKGPLLILGMVTLIAFPLFNFRVEPLVGIFAIILPAVLGLFTLSGEQTRRQYRFISDRGFSPQLYLLMRTIIPVLVIVVTTVVLLSIIQNSPERSPIGEWRGYFLFCGIALGIYFAYVFATLTFSNPLLAIFGGAAVVFTIGYGIVTPVVAGGYLGLWASIPLCLFALALPWLLVKRWMQLDTSNLTWISFASSVAIGLTAFTVYAPLRAFSVPDVAIQSDRLPPSFEPIPANYANIQVDQQAHLALFTAVSKFENSTNNHRAILENWKALTDQMPGSDMAGMGTTAESSEGSAPSPNDTNLENAPEIIKLQLEKLKVQIQSTENRNASPEVWKYAANGTALAEWLSAVVYYALQTEDRELLISAIDAYATIVNPKYPIEFSLYDRGAFAYLLGALNESADIGSPELNAIIFDRLIQNVPSPDVWSHYFIALGDADNMALNANHAFYNRNHVFALHRFYRNDYFGEGERFDRVKNLQTQVNIQRAVPVIQEMNQILATNQANRAKDPASLVRTAPFLELANRLTLDTLYSGNAETDRIMTNYITGNYGTVSIYPMPDKASANLQLYYALLNAAARGTQRE